jgi:hypothetical protein
MMMNAFNHRGMGLRMLAAVGERQRGRQVVLARIRGWPAVEARLPSSVALDGAGGVRTHMPLV